LRTRYRGEYQDLKGRKWRETGEDAVTSNSYVLRSSKYYFGDKIEDDVMDGRST